MFERRHEEHWFGKRAAQPQELPAALATLQKNIAPELRFLVGATDDELMAGKAAQAVIKSRSIASPATDPVEDFVKTQGRVAQGLESPSSSALADLNLAKIIGTDASWWTSGVSLSPADAAVNKIAQEQREFFSKRFVEKSEKLTWLQTQFGSRRSPPAHVARRA